MTTQSTDNYRFASSVHEDQFSDSDATFGAQFCWKPCASHLKGGGSVWPGRSELKSYPSAKNKDTSPFGQQIGTQRVGLSHPLQNDDEVQFVSERKNEKRWRDLFCTCNGTRIRVYEARKGLKPMLLQVYQEEDGSEQFYCLTWTYNVTGSKEWWIAAAGRKGILRVISVNSGTAVMGLSGHGEAINDIKTHPTDPALVMTASKDESLRLWNLRTGSTLAVFAGLKGHRGEVVHLDFNATGSRVASCGIDNSVRIWEIDPDEKVMKAILESHEAADLGVKDPYVYQDANGEKKKLHVPIIQFPHFITRKVHKHYVDCVMWVGDLLLSKSVHNRMFLWEPGNDRESLSVPASSYELIEEYVLNVCNVWFIRFGMDRDKRLVACGNDEVR